MKTIDYLNKAMEKMGLSSDNQLAKHLELSSGAMSHYRKGIRTIDDYTAARLAEILEIPAIEVIAVANAEREKDGRKREFWIKLTDGAKCAMLAAAMMLGTAHAPRAGATAHNAHYGKRMKWA